MDFDSKSEEDNAAAQMTETEIKYYAHKTVLNLIRLYTSLHNIALDSSTDIKKFESEGYTAFKNEVNKSIDFYAGLYSKKTSGQKIDLEHLPDEYNTFISKYQ